MLRWIYIGIAIASVLALSFSDFLLSNSMFDVFPSSLLYFLDYFQIDHGINIITHAYIVRFLIRRTHLIS